MNKIKGKQITQSVYKIAYTTLHFSDAHTGAVRLLDYRQGHTTQTKVYTFIVGVQ